MAERNQRTPVVPNRSNYHGYDITLSLFISDISPKVGYSRCGDHGEVYLLGYGFVWSGSELTIQIYRSVTMLCDSLA